MSAHALSPRSADFLPPTLQPHAVTDAAPGTDRRTSFAVACLLYAGIGATLAVAARNPEMLRVHPRTTSISLVDPDEVIPQPPAPAAVESAVRAVLPPARSAEEKMEPPPVQTNVVPETADALPQIDMSHSGLRSVETQLGTGVTGADTGLTPAVTRESQPPAPPAILDVAPTALRVLHQVQPNYPPIARIAHVQGAVVLQMVIDASGVPTDVRVVSSAHPALEGESLRVARMWRFEPARLEGHPVAARFNLTLNFVLRR